MTKRNVGPASLGLRTTGSPERSAAWRRNYDEVFWGPGVTGLKRIGRRQVKIYGPAENSQLALKLNEAEN